MLNGSTENMNINIPYDESKDRTFFKDPSKQGTYVDIGNESCNYVP